MVGSSLATKQLLNTVSDVEKEYKKNFSGPVEVLHDRIAYTSVDMLKCIQQMELETISQASIENMGTNKLGPNTAKYNAMYDLLDWAREILYEQNNNAIDMMIDTYTSKERPPLYIREESEKDYTPRTALAYANKAIYAHQEAFSEVIENARNIIKHGLPPESDRERLIDKLRPTVAKIRANNEQLIKNLLSKEMDIDYINNFVCYDLEKQAAKFMAIAVLEESYLAVHDSDFNGRSELRDIAEEYLNTKKDIRNGIGDMRKFEVGLLPSTNLDISKSANGSYTITITQGNGVKREAEIKGDNVTYKRTTLSRRGEYSRMMKLGKMSKALRIEKESYIFTLKGKTEQTTVKTHNPEKENEKKTTTNEQSYGQVEASKERTAKVIGNKQTRMNLRFHAARFAGRKIKSYSIGPYTEQKEIMSGRMEVLGGSASAQSVASDKVGTPVLKAEIHPIQAGASLFGINGSLGMGASISAGKQLSAEDIIKSAAGILVQELQNGSAANITKILDGIAEMLKGVDPSTSVDWGSIHISTGNMEIMSASVERTENGETQNIEYQVDANCQLAQDVEDMIDMATEASQKMAKMNAPKTTEPEVEMEPTNDNGLEIER